jgi:hypothetical protein
MESNGGRAGTQPYPSHGADTSGQNNSIYHEGLDRRGESRNHCARTTGVTKDKQNIRELQQRKLKLAALTISGEAKADDHTFLEVRISQCDSGYQQLTLVRISASCSAKPPQKQNASRASETRFCTITTDQSLEPQAICQDSKMQKKYPTLAHSHWRNFSRPQHAARTLEVNSGHSCMRKSRSVKIYQNLRENTL